MTHLSASRIARIGLALPPADGPAAPEATACMACGAPIASGEPAIAWKPSKSTFTDFQYLAAPQTGVVCADCRVFLDNKVLQKTQKCVISETGAWSLSKDAHRAWWLTEPPAPPFVAMISDSMKQHLVWRAAPTLDRQRLTLQLGRRSLTIDRPLALEATDWCRSIADAARQAGIKVTPNHPFERLDRDMVELSHAALRADVAAIAMDDPTLRDPLQRLLTLGNGELWALAVLAKSKPETPKAEPITL